MSTPLKWAQQPLNYRVAVRLSWEATTEPGIREGLSHCLFFISLHLYLHPQVPGTRMNQAESLFYLEKGLMGQGRSQTYQQVNQAIDVNITRNGTKQRHIPPTMTQKWIEHHLWDNLTKSIQHEFIMRKDQTNSIWGTFHKILPTYFTDVNYHERQDKNKTNQQTILG